MTSLQAPSVRPDTAAAVDGPVTDGRRSALPAPRVLVTAAALAAIGALAYAILADQGARLGVLFAIGLAFGVALYHARFGFTSAWRRLVAVGQGAGLRAHALMLAAASLLFAPILATGAGLFGQAAEGNVSPIGLSVALGAFLFGVGMQLGGACASGTLYTIGGGQSAIVLTLAAFIGGSVLGAWHWGFWTQDALNGPAVSLAEPFGYPAALAITLAVLALIALASVAIERRRRPPRPSEPSSATGPARVLRGTWPLWVGALVLAALNAATLLVKGSPWGITSAFALWGSKLAGGMGIDVASWAYWSGDRADSLAAPLLADATTVMNFGIILGALAAAAIGGTFALHRRIPVKTAVAAIAGGLLMGYGARLAYGCNIGAYFSGIASFSLHGWLWGLTALVGTYAGLKARPLFGLAVPRQSDSTC
ncbi:MAG: YeeE/YedE family protein [Thermoleophilaceae bacterium]|jgi:uncharacterized membrane protein YedE/YeeE